MGRSQRRGTRLQGSVGAMRRLWRFSVGLESKVKPSGQYITHEIPTEYPQPPKNSDPHESAQNPDS